MVKGSLGWFWRVQYLRGGGDEKMALEEAMNKDQGRRVWGGMDGRRKWKGGGE